jgi:hypothetical protein
MLERQGLVLCPWTPPALLANSGWEMVAACDRVRPVLDAASRQFLGFAAATPARGRALAWFRRMGLEVYESDDASLLFRIYPPWLFSWTWDVFDAEQRHIGIIFRGMLFDTSGERFGLLSLSSAGDRGKFVNGSGVDLAAFELRDDDIYLHFRRSVEGQPFVRMILLGAVLSIADRLNLGKKQLAITPATGAQPC